MVALRRATVDDAPTLVALYDEAVAWLAGRGRTDQWGSTPFSELPDVVALIRSRTAVGTFTVDLLGGPYHGCLLEQRLR